MTSALASKDFGTMKRYRTSILPYNNSDTIEIQGFYWPRRVVSHAPNKSNKMKPIKAKQQRKYSLSKERQCIAECLKLLPKISSDLDRLQSTSVLQELACTPNQQQAKHFYAWHPTKQDIMKTTQSKSRIVPEKFSQRKAFRCQRGQVKG